MNTFKVREWMTPDPVTISPLATLLDAHHVMKVSGIRHLPVMAGDRLMSLVTLNDIRRAELETAATYRGSQIKQLVNQLRTISEIMEPDPVCVDPDASIQEAAGLLLEQKLTGLAVVENGRLVGIITESDIFRLLIELQPAA